jgi:glycosyltransferase involved in cell wall biosynthesis
MCSGITRFTAAFQPAEWPFLPGQSAAFRSSDWHGFQIEIGGGLISLSSMLTLSAIVPNYNHARHLPVCLKSILAQSVAPMEIIVLDDASTDNSVEVIRQFAAQSPLVRLVQNERNLGVMATLNKGLDLARGDYIFLQAADDEVLPGLFEKSLHLLAQHPEAGLSCTVSRWCYVDSGITWHMGTGMAEQPAYLSPDDLVRVGQQGKLFISSSSAILRKAALFEVGRMVSELRWHADWFSCFALAFRFGLCFVPEPLCQFNIHSHSFYQAGRKGVELRRVLTHLVELLNSPAFADVGRRTRDSGALSLFAMPMLWILLSRPEYRSFINATYLRRTLRRSAELVGKKILPRWLARRVLDRFYRARIA